MKTHPLEHLVTSTGLRRAVMYHDVACTLHRCRIAHADTELAALTDEQIIMALIISNLGPETAAWTYAEKRLGRTLPKE